MTLEGDMKRETGSRAALRRWAPVLLVLMAAMFMFRMTNLMALPIFGDEAIYLRWGQLVLSDSAGVGHPWVSLADPKPPLHFWLIAAVLRLSSDPLLAARGISVAAAILSVPLLFLVCWEAGHLLRNRAREGQAVPSGAAVGLLSVILLIFCPFVAFYQRMALAEALFLAESLAIVWMSLRWARLAGGKGGILAALGLGVAIGLGLMTRQGISYTLCAMPVGAWVAHRWMKTADSPRRLLLILGELGIAAVVALAIWSPYLLAELSSRALDSRREAVAGTGQNATQAKLQSGDLFQELKRRILYQEKFTNTEDRGAIVKRNLLATFVPTASSATTAPASRTVGKLTPETGWLFYYLTPGIYVVSLLGVVWLIVKRQWAWVAFLGLWGLVTLGPVIVLGNVVYSRYVMSGVPPLLIAGAFVLSDVMGTILMRWQARAAWKWAMVLLGVGGLFWMPIREMGLQATRWWDQTLTRKDRYQYVNGWTSGLATQRALRMLRGMAREGPIVVITGNEWGTPADAIWAYLSRDSRVQVYYTDKRVILGAPTGSHAGQWGYYSLRNDKWLYTPYTEVRIPEGVPVFYVTQHMWGDRKAEVAIRANNPNLSLRETFLGVGTFDPTLAEPDGEVVVFAVRTPPPPATYPAAASNPPAESEAEGDDQMFPDDANEQE